jgi:hypothetical protein
MGDNRLGIPWLGPGGKAENYNPKVVLSASTGTRPAFNR